MKWIIPENSLRLAPVSFSKDEIMVTEHIYKTIINTFNHHCIDLFFLSLSLCDIIYRTTCFATPFCCQLEVVVSCWFQTYPTICVSIICYLMDLTTGDTIRNINTTQHTKLLYNYSFILSMGTVVTFLTSII